MHPTLVKFLSTVEKPARDSVKQYSNYAAIMSIMLNHWPICIREKVEQELKSLNSQHDKRLPSPLADLIWQDLNAKDNYEYINRHKYFVSLCYDLFNNVIITRVKPQLQAEGLLLLDYRPEQDPTDEQIAAHDNSKYDFLECVTYSMQWFPDETLGERDGDSFSRGLQHHYCNNEHHPEFWQGRAMPWRYIVEAVYDMAAMELEKKFNRIMPQARSQQLGLITFEDKFLQRFHSTHQFDFIQRLLRIAQTEFLIE